MIDTQAIRSKLLDLAIRGKLTERLPKDGTAEELYRQIQEEKQALFKAGKIRKEKPLPENTGDEIPFEIPANWRWVVLGNIASKISSGNTPTGGRNSDVYVASGFPFFREQNIYDDGIHQAGMVFISEKLLETRQNSTVKAKDILLNITGGSIGRCALVPDNFDRGSINQHILIIRMVEPETRFYLHMLIRSSYVQSHIKDKAVGDKDGFSGGRCKRILVPLPPLAEQHRIVERLEQAFSVLDTIDALQAQYTDNLTVLKTKLLDAAIQGKLTDQLPEDGTAEDLYQQIQTEKQALIKAGKLKKEKPLPEITAEEIPFEIPANWKWVRLASISSIINGDRGKNYPAKSTLKHEGIPFISALNLNGVSVTQDEHLLCLDDRQYELLGNGKLQKDDIVICIRGSLGKHGRYPFDKGAIASSLVICRLLYSKEIIGDYLVIWLDSSAFPAEIKRYDSGTAQPNLAANSLEQFLIPLPPLAEQKRIVVRLNALLAVLK